MKTYSPEVKAEVIGSWIAGSSLNHLASAHGITKSTIQGWVKGRTRTALVPKNEKTPEDYLDDIAWRHIDAGQLATEAILRKATDAGWLDKQNADALAIFYGVIADKQLRLLAAFQRADEHGEAALTRGSG